MSPVIFSTDLENKTWNVPRYAIRAMYGILWYNAKAYHLSHWTSGTFLGIHSKCSLYLANLSVLQKSSAINPPRYSRENSKAGFVVLLGEDVISGLSIGELTSITSDIIVNSFIGEGPLISTISKITRSPGPGAGAQTQVFTNDMGAL